MEISSQIALKMSQKVPAVVNEQYHYLQGLPIHVESSKWFSIVLLENWLYAKHSQRIL